MLREDRDKTRNNSPVTFVTHKRLAVLFFSLLRKLTNKQWWLRLLFPLF